MDLKRIDQFFDILIILLLDLLSIIFVLIPPFNQTPLRIIFALPILLFLPGYMLIAAMFPRKEELSGIERFTLSIGLSIAIFVFDGFAISVTPWRFRPMPIIVSLTWITLFFTLLTLITRFRTPAEKRYFFGPTTISEFVDSLKVKEEPTDIERALMIALIGSIIIASSMLIYAKLTFEEEKFTALYILGKEGKAENYPSELYILEKNPIIVGVENYEHAPVNYTLQIKLGEYLLHERSLTLNHNEKWEDTVYLTPKHVGKHLKLEFLLYKDELLQPYRSVHLWVDSVINYDNLREIREFALSELPEIEDSDMENEGWTFNKNSDYFRGYFTELHQIVENVTLHGYVIDANTSKPVPNARINFDNHYEYRKSVNADENGSYAVMLIPDYFWISVSAKGYKRNDFELDLSENRSMFLNLTVQQTMPLKLNIEELAELNETIEEHPLEEFPHAISVLRGYVINHLTGEPVPYAEIKVTHELGFIQKTKTDEFGYYEIKVISGAHRIEIRADGYAANFTNYRIGSVHELDLVLLPKSCKVKGYIVDEKGRPVSDVSISLRSRQFSNSTRSNLTGYYELNSIPGSFTLKAEKRGYFGSSAEFNLTAYETKLVNLTVERILPACRVEGYVSFNDRKIPGVDVILTGIDYKGNPVQKSTRTDFNGFFKADVLPGTIFLNVLQGYSGEEVRFYARSGKKVFLNIQLEDNPESTFKMIYPSQTKMVKGYYSEIYQEIASAEGLATLIFKVKDSYKSDRESGIYKQVLLNNHVIWEDDISGDEGWEEVKIPVTFDEGVNRLSMRLYAKKDANGPVIVEWDAVKLEPISEIIKDRATIFSVRDADGGQNFTTELFLGKHEEFIVSIENEEQERVNYTLEIRLDDVVHKKELITLNDGEKWEKIVLFIPEVLGEFIKLEFLLFKNSEKPYKYFSLWVSSEIDYNNLHLLKKYSEDVPMIANSDMEALGEWDYYENEINFTGRISSDEFVSPFHSYEILATYCNQSCYAGIKQELDVEKISNAVVSLDVKDSYKKTGGSNFFKQVLLNGKILWNDDVAGDEGWLHENIPVTILPGKNIIELRVYSHGKVLSPVKVWWDNIELKPVTEILNETTKFAVYDSYGGENYLRLLYLGMPSSYTVSIENRENRTLDYTLQVRLAGILHREYRIKLNHAEIWYENVTVIPEVIGDNLLLEFILLKEGKQYRYFSLWVSSDIDYSNPSILKEYEISIPPPIDNGDFEGSGGWSYSKKGLILWEVSLDEYASGNRSLRVYQDGVLNAEDYVSIYQDAGTVEKGVTFVTFSVKDNYNEPNATGYLKQVLLNDRVLWEDDVAESEGWQKLSIPVYFSGVNRLSFRVYAEREVEYADISVFWDDISLKTITGGKLENT
jgi:uncharacterized membrane protein/protocatechuate 3,4-dioxygenase beta subunit